MIERSENKTRKQFTVVNPESPPPTRTSPWVFVVVGLLVAAIVVIGVLPKLERKAALEASATDVAAPRLVVTSTVKKAASQSELVLPASATPIESAQIYTRISGYVRELRVNMGDKVQKGQVLAVLDAPEVEADLRRAQAKLAESERNVSLSDATAQRFARLAEAGATSKQQADEASTHKNSAEALVLSNRADVERLQTLLSFRTLTAPFAGVITKRNVDQGALVTQGSSGGIASLFELSRIDMLRVLIDVPQAYAPAIKVGDTVTVINGKIKVPGKIARTSGALDPQTRTLKVEVHAAGDQGILSGSFVRVAFVASLDDPPTLVPANALVSRSKGLLVFTLTSDGELMRVNEKPIVLGRELGATAEVLSGLEGNEVVVVNAPENLQANERVRISPAGKADNAKH
jgi:RND family efflux transporter MFP subunit